MITNLIASIVITLVTNTTDRFPQIEKGGWLGAKVSGWSSNSDNPSDLWSYAGESHGDGPAFRKAHLENVNNPTEKWTATTIKQLEATKINYQSGEFYVTNEVILSSHEEHFIIGESQNAPHRFTDESDELLIKKALEAAREKKAIELEYWNASHKWINESNKQSALKEHKEKEEKPLAELKSADNVTHELGIIKSHPVFYAGDAAGFNPSITNSDNTQKP